MKLFSIILLLILSPLSMLAQQQKMSSWVRRITMQEQLSQRHSLNSKKAVATNSKERRMMIFVRTADTELLRQKGCKILASWDDIHIVSAPISRLSQLAQMPQINRIEASQSCQLTNDTTAHIVGVSRSPFSLQKLDDVRHTQRLTGRNVVVGVMDVGFDLTHPNFYSTDGQEYRIKALWDMLDRSPEADTVNFENFEVVDSSGVKAVAPGRQYTNSQALLNKGATADSALVTHGTHTCGTAAGSGWGGTFDHSLKYDLQFSGMAPAADICLVSNAVSNNLSVIPEEERTLYTTATDMLGFKYIFDYADRVGKPCVINFSEGSHEDLYENLLYNEVIDKMVGPGRILCVSAGNEGEKGTYIHKPLGREQAGAFLYANAEYGIYTFRSDKPVKFSLNFYSNGKEEHTYEYDTTTLSEFSDSLMTEDIIISKDTLDIMMTVYRSCLNAEHYVTELLMQHRSDKTLGSYPLPISLILKGDDYEVEAFATGGYFKQHSLDLTLSDFSYDHNILFPGSAAGCITVGATGHMGKRPNYYEHPTSTIELTDGSVAKFSSKGPTMAGHIKPDVVAPGCNILSSYSSFMSALDTTRTSKLMNYSQWNERHYPWYLNSGTSMAAPVVTGIIALWLELCPTLTPDDIRDVLAHSCLQPDATLTYPNNIWGYGEIDALAGVNYIKEHFATDITSLPSEPHLPQGIFDLSGRRLHHTDSHRGIIIVNKGGKMVKMVR